MTATAQPQQQGEKNTCTSPKTPEKVVIEGVLLTLNLAGHTLVVEDKDGISHPARWNANSAVDEYMKKQRQGFGESLTGIVTDGVMEITGAAFFDKKTLPQRKGGSGPGGWKGQPKNDRAIIMQCALKVCADIYSLQGISDPKDTYDIAMEKITEKAIVVAERICKASGVP